MSVNRFRTEEPIFFKKIAAHLGLHMNKYLNLVNDNCFKERAN